MNVREVLEMAKKNKVQVVDLKFVDLIGTWQHFTVPVSELTEGLFKDGSGLDGSSIRGWRAINNSDMLLIPDPATACMDPFCSVPTLSLIGNVVDPITREMYDRDPRYIAQKAEKYLQSTKIGDTSYWGPEAEFFIFDHARYDQTNHSAYYYIDSDEGVWNMGQEGVNLGGKIRHKEGYFPVAPTDTQQDIRTEMVLEMEKAGIATEKHHHEVATAGQAEIDIRFDSLVRTADKMMMFKYIVKNVARRHGKTVTFMPKPIFGDNGSGMHTHQSIWKDGKPLFAGKEYAGVSQLCLHYIGGILKHAPALAAFTNPSTNSYKRLRRASKRRCCWPIPAVTGRRASAFRCTHRAPRRSASKSDSRTLRPIPTWPSPPCSWRVWTASKTRLIRASQQRRTSTISRPRKRPRFGPCRAAWTRPSATWRRIINSCSRAGCSVRI